VHSAYSRKPGGVNISVKASRLIHDWAGTNKATKEQNRGSALRFYIATSEGQGTCQVRRRRHFKTSHGRDRLQLTSGLPITTITDRLELCCLASQTGRESGDLTGKLAGPPFHGRGRFALPRRTSAVGERGERKRKSGGCSRLARHHASRVARRIPYAPPPRARAVQNRKSEG
jgi:hypothetical protein